MTKEHLFMKFRNRLFRLKVRNVGSELYVFGKNIIIENSDKLYIGKNFRINERVYIHARGGITIGNNVTLSVDSKIISTGYDLDRWVMGERVHIEREIYIGDYVWVCAGAIICPGVRITGKHVVIAAGAVVTHDITEDNCIYGGVPAYKIRNIEH